MRSNIKNIYQLMAYLQVQRFLCLLIVLEYVKAIKVKETVASYGLREKESNRTRMNADEPRRMYGIRGRHRKDRISFKNQIDTENLKVIKKSV